MLVSRRRSRKLVGAIQIAAAVALAVILLVRPGWINPFLVAAVLIISTVLDILLRDRRSNDRGGAD